MDRALFALLFILALLALLPMIAMGMRVWQLVQASPLASG